MNIDMNKYVLRTNTGNIDHEATIERFRADLNKFAAERETEIGVISNAVHTVLDGHKGKRVPMPFLASEVLRALNVQPENYKTLTEKVLDYVRVSDEFSIGKGKNGGVARVIDLPVK